MNISVTNALNVVKISYSSQTNSY